jgi:hypothetical protein
MIEACFALAFIRLFILNEFSTLKNSNDKAFTFKEAEYGSTEIHIKLYFAG